MKKTTFCSKNLLRYVWMFFSHYLVRNQAFYYLYITVPVCDVSRHGHHHYSINPN